jgi:aspartate aminotransferase
MALAAREAGKKVYGLNIGQPDLSSPPEVLDRLRAYNRRHVPYGPSQGLPELVEALVAYYARAGLAVEPEQVFVTTGGSEGILFVLGAICDPGDQVLVFEPFYTNYRGFASLLGVELVAVRTEPEDGYHLPPRPRIEERVGPRSRAILICSPNNPTGTVYTDEELGELAAICRERDLFLVADEVYREFVYDGRSHRSILALDGLGDRAVVVDSLSKRMSLCGARVGNIVTRNRDLLGAVLKFGQARLCPPSLGQWVAAAIGEVSPRYFQQLVAEYEHRRNVVYRALAAAEGVVVRKPEGAFYVCPRLPVDDASRFAEWLLRDFERDRETVYIAPADGFYQTPGLGRDEARIAYVIAAAELERAMALLAEALELYPGRTARPRPRSA